MNNHAFKRATRIEEIQSVLAPRPLTREELGILFEETFQARDPHSLRRDEIATCLKTGNMAKVLVTGHPGSGKSTELVKFQEEHASEYTFVSFSFLKEAQLSQASIESLLVLIVETLVREFRRLDVPLDEKPLEQVYNWFSETFDIHERELDMGLALGGGADTKDTFWGKLLGLSAYLKSDIKAGSRTLNRSVTKENKRLSELAFQCNEVIREALLGIRNRQLPDLVIIIEDLDKVSPEAADAIFIQNPAPLTDLGCRIIFTAPISLLSNPRAGGLDSSGFSKVGIPMIRVCERDGGPCKKGREVLRKILDSRLDVNRLIDTDALDLAVEKTGGVLRHLFEALGKAAETVSQGLSRKTRQLAKIQKQDVRYGLNRLRAELVARVGSWNLPEEYKEHDITTKSMWERVRELSKKPRRLEPDPLNMLLLEGHAIIEYNGEGWHRVHPLIQEHLLEEMT